MNREELEKKAKDALAAAGDMAARGAAWVRNYKDSHSDPQTNEVIHDGNRRIY